MVIAVNTRLLLKDKLEGIGYFEREVFTRLALAHPEHSFYFLFDRAVPDMEFPANVKPVVIGPVTRLPVLWKLWFDFRLPPLLKKIKADVFVSPDGYASLRTRIPQCLIVHDLGFIHQPDAYKTSHRRYLKRNTPRFIKKAGSVAVVSEFTKKDIIEQYGTDPSKIDVVYSAVKESFKPLGFEERTAVKESYTGGVEYFIYAGAIQPRKNLINLLKAFSLFKKRQDTNWKLVLAGRLAWKNDEFLTLLKSYKYRNDVILTGYVTEDEMARLVASSYALVYPSFFEGFGVPVLEAMRCHIPALTSQHTSMQEIAGNGALYFDPADPADIADKLMLIYKDENLRNRLISAGSEAGEQFSWDRTAAVLWKSILRAVNP